MAPISSYGDSSVTDNRQEDTNVNLQKTDSSTTGITNNDDIDSEVTSNEDFVDLGPLNATDFTYTIVTQNEQDVATLQSKLDFPAGSKVTVMARNTISGGSGSSIAGTYKLGTKLLKKMTEYAEPGFTVTSSNSWTTGGSGSISFKVGSATINATVTISYNAGRSYSYKIPSKNSKGRAIKSGAIFLKGNVTIKLNSLGKIKSSSITNRHVGVHYKLK